MSLNNNSIEYVYDDIVITRIKDYDISGGYYQSKLGKGQNELQPFPSSSCFPSTFRSFEDSFGASAL